MRLLQGSFFLKALALVLAVVTYLYIHNEMYRIQDRIPDPSYKLIKLTAKKLPVKARLATTPPEGYRILINQVSANPFQVIVIGPEALLEEAQSAETALIDVSENTKTFTRKIALESVAGIHLAGEPHIVEVTVPIEKVETDEAGR